MKRLPTFGSLLLFLLSSLPVHADKTTLPAPALGIEAQSLGDTPDGVATRVIITSKPVIVPAPAANYEIQVSFLQSGKVLRRVTVPLRAEAAGRFETVQSLPVGEVDVVARILSIPVEGNPLLLAKGERRLTIARTSKPYVVVETDSAEAILAGGSSPGEAPGSVTIRPPKRDLSPHLFQVDVDVQPPVKRVEFYVDGKRLFTRNSPPYQAELDLGRVPKRVEVKAVGYDAAGRFVDADSWIVNEKENSIDVKLTRTVTPDGMSHVKVSVQKPASAAHGAVELFVDDRRVSSWSKPPYRIALKPDQLKEARLLRASTKDSSGAEVMDVVFLDGSEFSEQLDVHVIELPVTVTKASGEPAVNLPREDFKLFEEGKPQQITGFSFSTDLPLSVGVLIDHSGSMEKSIETAREAAIRFFRKVLGKRDQAFFGAFSWEAVNISPFASDVGTLQSHVSDMPGAEGGTALYDAIVKGLYRFRGVEGRKALVVVTDGQDTASRVPYEEMLTYVRAARVPLYFIGLGISGLEFSTSARLKSLADETGGSVVLIKEVAQLDAAYEKLEKQLRSQYVIAYKSGASSKSTAFRRVQVQVKQKDLKVKTIRGYLP